MPLGHRVMCATITNMSQGNKHIVHLVFCSALSLAQFPNTEGCVTIDYTPHVAQASGVPHTGPTYPPAPPYQLKNMVEPEGMWGLCVGPQKPGLLGEVIVNCVENLTISHALASTFALPYSDVHAYLPPHLI